jgi:hypothetical protein
MLDAMCARLPLLCLAQASQDKAQKKSEIASAAAPAAKTDLGDGAARRSSRALAQRAEH